MREGDSRIDNSDIKACTYWKELGPYKGRLNYVILMEDGAHLNVGF